MVSYSLKWLEKTIFYIEPIVIMLTIALSALSYGLNEMSIYSRIIFINVFPYSLLLLIIIYKLNKSLLLKYELVAYILFLLFGFFGYGASVEIIGKILHNDPDVPYMGMDIAFSVLTVPLITSLLGIFLIRNRKWWFIKHKKKLVFLLYIFVWFWFGCFYNYQAKSGNAKFYYSSASAQTEASIQGIMKMENYDQSEKYPLENIITNSEYKISPLKIGNGEYFTTDQIGDDWGDFYESWLAKKGYSYYTFILVPNYFVPKASNIDYYDVLRYLQPVLNKPFLRVELFLYNRNTEVRNFTPVSDSVFYIYPTMLTKDQLNHPSKSYLLLFNTTDFSNFLNVFSNTPDRHLSLEFRTLTVECF